MARTFGFLLPSLRPEGLIAGARKGSGLSDFGPVAFQDGLEAFLRACNDEAELSFFGRFATRWDVRRFLSNLLRLHDEESRAPRILEQRIERPIFIAGLPRSGTTFLHRLLAEDRTNRVPRVWELIHPYPAPGAIAAGDRRRRVDRQLRMFQFLAPEFRRVHPIDADSPQECSEITAHVFASARFDTTYRIPGYRSWLQRNGHVEAYRFHKRFVQHLQHQAGGECQWVFKCPDHVFALDAIRTVYPDARLVFVHRDPLRVLASNAHLTEVLRRPFTRRIDRQALGRQETEHWGAATELMIEAADRQPFAEPILDIHHDDLVGAPLTAICRLYEHFGLDLDRDAARRIDRLVEANPRGGYGANQYRFDTYGIDPALERERFAPYVARFSVDCPKNARRSSAFTPA